MVVRMNASAVVDLLRLLDRAQIDVWLDGGWGVDALLGAQTRPHKDVDIIVRLSATEKLRDILHTKGFVMRADDTPNNFVLADASGREIDVHAITFDDSGNGVYRMADGQDWIYPAAGFAGRGTINGVPVRCLTPDVQVLCHATGYIPTEKDIEDMERLRSRFGVALPANLRRRGASS
jgi:lincosamide nucleotidyltransferase A/C/D/E